MSFRGGHVDMTSGENAMSAVFISEKLVHCKCIQSSC